MATIVSNAKAYVKARQRVARKALKELELDALLVGHTPDVMYLTDFAGDDSVGLLTAKDFYLATDFRYKEQLEMEAGWVKLILREDRMADAVVQGIAACKARTVGYDVNYFTVGQLEAMNEALAGQKLDKTVTLKPCEDVMANIRKVKDDHEIELIRRSVAIAEEAFEAFRNEVKPGLSENQLAGILISEMRSRGASDVSFPPIIASGASSSLPHYKPTEALVKSHSPLVVDWGAMYRSYCSDLTRTLLLGQVSERLRKIYQVVLEAQRAAIACLRPGVTTRQADEVGRQVITQAGFGECFGHGLGHGIGLEIHEGPSLRKRGSEEELRPGMIVTVEPGIYLPGEGGVRIEDDVLITFSGCEVLSSLDKTLEGCHIG